MEVMRLAPYGSIVSSYGKFMKGKGVEKKRLERLLISQKNLAMRREKGTRTGTTVAPAQPEASTKGLDEGTKSQVTAVPDDQIETISLLPEDDDRCRKGDARGTSRSNTG